MNDKLLKQGIWVLFLSLLFAAASIMFTNLNYPVQSQGQLVFSQTFRHGGEVDKIILTSKEKFHNELQLSISDAELKLVRLAKSLPGNIWSLQNDKDMQYAFANTIDFRIPFDLLEVDYNDTLEFMFISARLGVKEYCIPYEMLLTVPRL